MKFSGILLAILICINFLSCHIRTSGPGNFTKTKPSEFKALWIQPQVSNDSLNAWTVYYKSVYLNEVPATPLVARIATDTKYWLWINGKPVVRMGGLKRGPTPRDTYFDEVSIKKYLNPGINRVAILVNYFGKNGFSHKSSGEQGLFFDLQSEAIEILSDSTWKAWPHAGFGETTAPHPNFRLPESNVFFNAQMGSFAFAADDYNADKNPNALVVGKYPSSPWNTLVARPIPLWKDFGLKSYENDLEFPLLSKGDTLHLQLPYNAQISPYFKIKSAQGGDTLDIRTDHYYGGGAPNIRMQYVTRPGIQEFEMPGWINGEQVNYYIPAGVEILDLRYRETGYDTEFSGSFTCDDPFFNNLHKKALRTLYVTMRDTYMDCPDRERAQWWGDEVLESGEAFYALDRQSDALVRKGILELINWQREDSTLFSPIPAGNWDKELPGQMLASVGYYGIYNYYLNTGDLNLLNEVYEPVKKYLALWKLKEDGTLNIRQGGWIWGDWGENKDIPLLLNTQYHLAQKGLYEMAKTSGRVTDADILKQNMETFKNAFNSAFWKENHYRSPAHQGPPDDRSQALAVLAGLADPEKYDAIYAILQKEKHASPYMEKYVAEALFQMNQPEFALRRLEDRFGTMVNHPTITTLWEGWGIGKEGFGGGTTNHAWSGGGLTLLSQYVAGIQPLEPGYKSFLVRPQLGFLKEVQAVVPSIAGEIKISIKKNDGMQLELSVPQKTSAQLKLPAFVKKITITHNAQEIKEYTSQDSIVLQEGTYKIIAK